MESFTPKQERNGATGSGGEQNSAQPGPDATGAIASAIGTAVAAADVRKDEAAGLITSPQGAGVDGHTLGAGGDMWEWDSGLAVAEQPGEA